MASNSLKYIPNHVQIKGLGNPNLFQIFSVHSARKVCRNARTSIYEVRRKSLCYRGFPPNSL